MRRAAATPVAIIAAMSQPTSAPVAGPRGKAPDAMKPDPRTIATPNADGRIPFAARSDVWSWCLGWASVVTIASPFGPGAVRTRVLRLVCAGIVIEPDP